MLRKPLVVLFASITAFSALLVGVSDATLAASPVVPMPNERFLTTAERAAAVGLMSRDERAAVGHLFTDGAPGLVVGHTRRGFEVTVDEGGTPHFTELGVSADPDESAFSVPNLASADGVVSGSKSGTQLWMSFTVVRTRTTSPYEWQLYSYAQWSGQQGANPFNGSPEILATSWAGGMYMSSQYGNGKQMADWPCNSNNVAGTNSDGTPSAGTAWEFKEWNGACLTRYFHTGVYVRQSGWKNKTDNALVKYYHTYSDNQFSVTISASPAISISPTSNQWALLLWNTIRH